MPVSKQYVYGRQVRDKDTKPTLFFQTFKAKALRFSINFWSKTFAKMDCFEAYSEPCQTSKIELFAKIVNGFQPLTIFAKSSVLDV